MKRKNLFTIALAILGIGSGSVSALDGVSSVLDLTAEDINGETVDLSQYRGKVVLIVNTASKCGFTGQYEGLQNLWERYGEEGLVVLGFPSDNFLNQEYGSEEEIAEFCQLNFGVTFPLFSKVDVKGGSIHPVFDFLTGRETAGEFSGRITWNFNKFLIDRNGDVVARFGSREEPESADMIAAIEAAL